MEQIVERSAPRASRRVARAAVLAQAGRIEMEEIDLPRPGARQVRVRLEGCGVCGSNLPVWEGRPWFGYPLEPGAPGHEGWGVIEEVGADVGELRPGERVGVLSQHAYATHDVANAEALVVLPEELGDTPFPAEPLGCAYNVFRRAGIEAGQTVAVIGVGFLGALLTQLASAAGARVIAISRRPYALEVARACGADETLPLADRGELEPRIAELTRGALCDRVIECAGLQETLDVAAPLARVRGRLVIAGFHQDGPRTVDMQLWNWRGLDVVNAHERDMAEYVEGMRGALRAVLAGGMDPRPLVTHEFPLERTDAALEAMRARPDGFLKAVVRT